MFVTEAEASVQVGAIFPTRQARTLLADKLEPSQFGSREFLDRIVQEWDDKTKHSIFRGRLTLTPSGVEKAFLPFVEMILQSIDSQVSNTKTRGFSESPYLQKRLREKHRSSGIHVLHADGPQSTYAATQEVAAGIWLTDRIGHRRCEFETCVTVEADLSPLATAATLRTNQTTGSLYFKLDFQMGVFFGGVPLAACCMWKENGVERPGEASILPGTTI
ncbi:hypothetical protein JCM1841_004633 [Sporobolomyces salmonicolor]